MTENVSKDNKDDTTKNSVWLLQWIRNRIRKNRNLIALFIGDTGSGKSLSSIRLAERVDPNFNVDRIVFTGWPRRISRRYPGFTLQRDIFQKDMKRFTNGLALYPGYTNAWD